MKKFMIGLTAQEKIAFVYNLSTLLSSGIPILEAVESMLEDSKGNIRKVLSILRADLQEGAQVSTSFMKFPMIFDEVTTSIVKASEQAGTLDVTLADIRIKMQKDQEFTEKVRAALIYPMLIGVVFSGVMAVILFFVMPKLSDVFEKAKVKLPLMTQLMFGLSKLLRNHWIEVVSIGIAMIIIFSLLMKYQRKLVINILTGLPGIVGLARQIDMTRFTRSLYLLLSSGLTITQSLELTQRVVGRHEVAGVIKRCHDMVLSGKYLSEGFKTARSVIPSMVIKITEAGEKSGTLDKSMQDVSDYMDYQTQATLRTLTASIEPIMLIVVGVLIGGMMVSIIMPMYGIISSVGNSGGGH